MYAGVPRPVPGLGEIAERLVARDAEVHQLHAARACAIMMFAGLMSRWTMPR